MGERGTPRLTADQVIAIPNGRVLPLGTMRSIIEAAESRAEWKEIGERKFYGITPSDNA